MFKYFIKTTFRSFKKFNKNFIINLIGLSVAFTCVILVALWVNDEYSVDKFHTNNESIHQVMFNYKNGGETYTFEWTPAPLSKASVKEIPHVEYATNVYSFSNNGIIIGENNASIRANEVYVGKDFFNMFSFELLQGEKGTVLNDNNSILISEDLAINIFGKLENVVGKTLKYKQQELSGLYKISGVFKSVPNNSTLQFDTVLSFSNLLEKLPKMNNWEANDPFTYIKTKTSSINQSELNAQLTALLAKNSPAKNLPSAFVRPFSNKYLYNNYENGIQSGGRIKYLKLFSVIALFILIIAAINFMNLSTAQASNRVKEIGVKKVLGIEKKGLVYQFLGESIVMSFFGLLFAIGFVFILLPQFNLLVNKSIRIDFNISNILSMLVITLFIGILSGLYPALYLSGFKTIKLLKGKFTAKNREKRIRQSLVVFQFTASVFLIIAMIVITSQINHVNNKELGYNKDQVLVFEKDGRLKTNLEAFLTEINNISGVLKTSSADLSHLTNNETSTRNVVWKGKDESSEVTFKYVLANYNFVELLVMDLEKGRTFSKAFSNEKDKIILNETAVSKMGLNNPIGETVKIWGADTQVIGVVKDFHFQSLYEKVQPLFMRVSEKGNEVLVKIAAGTERETIDEIKASYSAFNYGLPLDFRFLDSDYQKFYETETRVAMLSKYFGALAVILSCLGLFGLVTFNVGQRYKEIGVRKVLGANVANIVLLLSKDFLKLVLVSILISIPLSWLVMSNWLEDFAYRIELGFWVFALAGIIAIVIALFTISFQTIQAALSNPIRSLKSE